jgi:hypothetical protein
MEMWLRGWVCNRHVRRLCGQPPSSASRPPPPSLCAEGGLPLFSSLSAKYWGGGGRRLCRVTRGLPAPRADVLIERERVGGATCAVRAFHSRSTQQARWAPDDGDHGPRQSQLPNRNVRSTECVAVRTLQLTARDQGRGNTRFQQVNLAVYRVEPPLRRAKRWRASKGFHDMARSGAGFCRRRRQCRPPRNMWTNPGSTLPCPISGDGAGSSRWRE